MQPGQFDKRATFRERKAVPPRAGNTREAFEDKFKVWANFRGTSGAEAVEAGRLQDVENAIIRVRDTAQTRTINAAWRVLVNGRDWNIVSVSPPNRTSRLIEIGISTKAGG